MRYSFIVTLYFRLMLFLYIFHFLNHLRKNTCMNIAMIVDLQLHEKRIVQRNLSRRSHGKSINM